MIVWISKEYVAKCENYNKEKLNSEDKLDDYEFYGKYLRDINSILVSFYFSIIQIKFVAIFTIFVMSVII